jgi:hypothetical protein
LDKKKKIITFLIEKKIDKPTIRDKLKKANLGAVFDALHHQYRRNDPHFNEDGNSIKNVTN